MMFRVIVIIVGALALAACSSTPEWMSLDGLKPAPIVDTVRFESEPPGAEAKASNGQTCRTPCALALPTDAPLTVTFTLTGYESASENLEPIVETGSPPILRPNPVLVELTALPPPPVKKKPVRRTTKKPVATKKPAAKPATTTAPPPMTPAPAQAPAPAPWPAAPTPKQ
jgi:hypothetical protein